MKKTKAIRHSVRIFVFLTVLILVVSLHSIFGFIASLSNGTFHLELTENEFGGDWELMLLAKPKNNGLLNYSLSSI